MSLLKRLRDLVEEVRWEDAADPSAWVRFARGQVRLYFYILRELVRNRCPQQAAALTFTTLLSLVPLFAVAFSFFRGFAALEGVQNRAQDAIFHSILATPLLTRHIDVPPQAGPAEAFGPAEGRTPAELLAEADARSRYRELGRTVRLYLAALEAGADPAAVRRGMSTLYLAAAPDLRQAFGAAPAPARAAHFDAAGLRPPLSGAAAERPEQAADAYEEGSRLAARGEQTAALEAFARAEAAGYPAALTRRAMADVYASVAQTAAQGDDLAGAEEHYRAALLSYCDALMAAAPTADEEGLRTMARAQGRAVQALGEVLYDRAREAAALYEELREPAPEAAQARLEAALRDLTEAGALLEHSSRAGKVYEELGRLHETAGHSEEALAAYRTALETQRAAAAMGLSMAVVDHIRLFIDKVGRTEIGIVGILFLLVTATSLLSTIEKTLNHIWKVEQRRPFWIKFTSYCTLIWLGPALIGASLWFQERLGGYIEGYLGGVAIVGLLMRLVTAVGEHVLPLLMTWLVLVALYKFLPHTHVKFRSVAWGALLAAILLQGARPLFTIYVMNAVKYQKIYGSLGAMPIFLLWIWLQWLIVLFGAEVSFTIQSMGLLRFHDKLQRLSGVFIDRYLAARIMMYVAREFWQSGRPITAGELAEMLQMTPEEAADAAGRLVRLGLLTPVGEEHEGYHPARDLSKLGLSEVLSITDRFRAESRSPRPEDRPYEDVLESAFRSSIRAQEEALEEMTFRELLRRAERQSGEAEGEG